MTNVLQWITRNVSTLARGKQATTFDPDAEFERVDGQRLDASDFRASRSMRLEPAAIASADFSETLPACSFKTAPSSKRAPLQAAA